jgi:hypothetical protein
MIAIAKPEPQKTYTDDQVNAKYLELMPRIVKIAKYAFKDLDGDRQADAMQSVLVTAFMNLKGLAASGRLEEACATPIAMFAIRKHKSGRPGGIPQLSRDVMGERCRTLGRSMRQGP